MLRITGLLIVLCSTGLIGPPSVKGGNITADTVPLPAPLRTSVKTMLDTAVAADLVRTIRNEDFRAYIKRHAGAQQLNLLDQFNPAGDTALLQQYFIKRSSQLRTQLQSVIQPESFPRFGPPKHQLQGLQANVIWEDVPGIPFQSRVLLHGADRITMANIPFDISYNNLFSFGGMQDEYMTGGLFKVNFNREAYLQKINSRLQTFYDLKKFFLKEIDLESAMRIYVDQRMNSIRGSLDSLYGKTIAGVLPRNISVDQLVQLDSNQLKRLFNTEEIQRELMTGVDSTVRTALQKQQAGDAAIAKVMELKRELESGVPAREQLERFDQVKAQLSKWVNTDESRIRNAKELFPLSGWQRFFLRVKELNVGSFGTDVSAASVSGLFMQGGAASFLNKGKMLMMGLGTRTDGSGMKDAFLTENASPNKYAMQFIRLGKGAMEGDHTHMTLLNANSRDNHQRQMNQQFLPRNIFVGTVSQQLELGEYGVIKGDFSKSNSQYAGVTAGNNGYAVSQKAAAMSFFNDFWQTVSLGLQYSGEVREWGLSQRVYASYAGMGYNNPGTPFGTRGAWQYGVDVRRRWKFHRMVTGFRADLRDIQSAFDAKWKSRQYTADVQFRVKRNWTFNTRMMQSSMAGSGAGKSLSGFLTRQLSLTSQYSGHIGSLPASNLVVAGLQQMRFTTEGVPLNSLLANVSVAENIVIRQHILSLNLFYNRDVKQNALYGNLLNMDAGWSYQLLKGMHCTSGLTFLDNTGIVTQLGLRQTVGYELIPGLHASVYVDCRKNFYSSPQNYLFGTFRSEFSLQYLID